MICFCRFLVDTIKVSIEIKKGEDGLVSKEEVECKVKAWCKMWKDKLRKKKLEKWMFVQDKLYYKVKLPTIIFMLMFINSKHELCFKIQFDEIKLNVVNSNISSFEASTLKTSKHLHLGIHTPYFWPRFGEKAFNNFNQIKMNGGWP